MNATAPTERRRYLRRDQIRDGYREGMMATLNWLMGHGPEPVQPRRGSTYALYWQLGHERAAKAMNGLLASVPR